MIGISDLDSHINSVDLFSTIYIINDFSDLSIDICKKKIKYGTIVKSDKNQSLDLCNMHIYYCDLLCIINIWLLKGNQI